MGYFRSSVVVTRGLLARSNFVTEISSTFLRVEIYRRTFPQCRTHRRLAEKGFIDGYKKLKIDSVLRQRLLTNYKTIPFVCRCARVYWIKFRLLLFRSHIPSVVAIPTDIWDSLGTSITPI